MTVWLNPRHALRSHLVQKFDSPDAPRRATTVVSLQEQLRGWLAKLHRARLAEELIRAYDTLSSAFEGYGAFELLPYDAAAHTHFEDLRRQKVRVPTMDLRITCICLTRGATLLTRNLRDFRQVPGLTIEDWSR